MISELDIQVKLSELRPDQVSLMEFERWIQSASWNMHKDSDPHAVEIASAILFLFSQYGDGDLNEQELREELANAARPFMPPRVYAPPQRIVFGTPLRFTASSAVLPFEEVVVG